MCLYLAWRCLAFVDAIWHQLAVCTDFLIVDLFAFCSLIVRTIFAKQVLFANKKRTWYGEGMNQIKTVKSI
jgi:hypothetical protein